MQLVSAIAIYFLLWIFSAFVVMPFGLRTHADEGTTPEVGHADSAPVNFRPGRIALRTTILAAILFVLFYLNYENGWVTMDDLNWMPPPPDIVAEQDLRTGG